MLTAPSELAGPPKPPSRAARVRAVISAVLATAIADESVTGVYFSRAVLGGLSPFLPRGDMPIVVLGPSVGLMLLAVVNSELGRGLKIVVRNVNGHLIYIVSGRGLRGLVLVFGSGLGSVVVIGDTTKLPPELVNPGDAAHEFLPPALQAELNPALTLVAYEAQSTVLAQAVERDGKRAQVASKAEAPASLPAGTPSVPTAPAAPTVPALPTLPAPATPTSPSNPSLSGAGDGGHSPVSAVLAARTQLEALMFAGLVRLRQWAPSAPTLRILTSPG